MFENEVIAESPQITADQHACHRANSAQQSLAREHSRQSDGHVVTLGICDFYRELQRRKDSNPKSSLLIVRSSCMHLPTIFVQRTSLNILMTVCLVLIPIGSFIALAIHQQECFEARIDARSVARIVARIFARIFLVAILFFFWKIARIFRGTFWAQFGAYLGSVPGGVNYGSFGSAVPDLKTN